MVSHTRKRSEKAAIVGMFAKIRPEVLIGGGSAYFLPRTVPGSKRKDEKDYVEDFRKAG